MSPDRGAPEGRQRTLDLLLVAAVVIAVVGLCTLVVAVWLLIDRSDRDATATVAVTVTTTGPKTIRPRDLPATLQRPEHPGVPLPDPAITPGDLNPAVTPDTIKQTICVPGYSKTVRPSVGVTNKLKEEVAKLYGIQSFKRGDYEGDHLIPISIGGNPESDKTHLNFWNEPWSAVSAKGEQVGARTKDGVEFYLYKHVCSGDVPLRTAQREMATDWYAAWLKYGKPRSPLGVAIP